MEEIRREMGESSKGNVSNNERQVKPFPHRGEPRKKKKDPGDFMEIFGKVEINLRFLQALKLPIFSKFIKGFIAGKIKPIAKIVIGETVSAVIEKRRMPSKRTNLGMFTLPISIGNIKVEHAMCDLGTSINVLPLSLYKKLEGVRMVDTKLVIQLADRSCISPEGVLENVIVELHDFLYPADFHVIKMKLMQEQVENSELSHSIDKEVANWCEAVNTLGMTDEDLAEAILEFCKSLEFARSKELVRVANGGHSPAPEGFITKETKKNPLPQETSATKKELKTLPPGLRYANLEDYEMFPVIINSNLTRKQEEELLEVHRRNKTAIGWTQ
ncbi:uncharacterized protein LOC121776780 [Salvia splendens]|uniref:uncharacterized protein LOC121776780 n=1 Tax=Salvia splendens TaxID=180675 RepID=UPI001C268111|nr:uncharacterized protein LOC121776780 [Salvia splendens]